MASNRQAMAFKIITRTYVRTWKCFPYYWPFIRGTTGHRCFSSQRASYAMLLWISCSTSSRVGSDLQYIPRNMHTVFALLCFVVVKHWLIFPHPSGLLHWHCCNLTIAPVPAKQPWWTWINTSCEFIMNDYITTTKQSTTKPCAYFLGYTVDTTTRMPHHGKGVKFAWKISSWFGTPGYFESCRSSVANKYIAFTSNDW